MATDPGIDRCAGDAAVIRLTRPLLNRPIERSIKRITPHARRVTPAVLHRIIHDHLVERLTPVVAPALVSELAAARRRGTLPGTNPADRFDAFVDSLQDRRRREAFHCRYPFLGPALDRMVAHYADFMIEMFRRLDSDWPWLYRTFAGGRGEPLTLASIELAGDAHSHGRSVAVLTWTSMDPAAEAGAHVQWLDKESSAPLDAQDRWPDQDPSAEPGAHVRWLDKESSAPSAPRVRWLYKPRDLRVDDAFGGLLDWLGTRVGERFLHPAMVTFEGYGWCACLHPRPCADTATVKVFYRRLGGIAAALHLLLARDVHAGNLIAHGASPVMVDLEGVMPPRFAFHRGPEHAAASHLLLALILPQRLEAPGGWLDPSAIGGMEGTGGPLIRGWRDAGTDGMHAVWRPFWPPPAGNRPVLHGTVVEPCDHEDAFTAGFTAAFDTIARQRTYLVGPDSPLRAFRGAVQRVALRSTSAYRFLLRRSWSAAAWRESCAREAVTAGLCDDLRGDGVFPMIAAAERADLLAGDVPLFRTRTDACRVVDAHGQPIPLLANETGFDRVRRHVLENFTTEARRRQLATMRAAFASRRNLIERRC